MSYLLSHYAVVLLLLLFEGSFKAGFVASVFMLTPLLHPTIRQTSIKSRKKSSAKPGFFMLLWFVSIFTSAILLSAQGQWASWSLHILWVIIPEEFFFRVFFWRVMQYEESSGYSQSRMILINSLIFTAFHLFRAVSLENFLIFFPGLALAWTFSRFRSLSLNCIIHLSMNLIYASFMLPYNS